MTHSQGEVYQNGDKGQLPTSFHTGDGGGGVVVTVDGGGRWWRWLVVMDGDGEVSDII